MSTDAAALRVAHLTKLQEARQAQRDANQAYSTALDLLKATPWGRIKGLDWTASWESDDSGGTDLYCSSFSLTVGSTRIPLGYSLDDRWEDFWAEYGDGETPTDATLAGLVKKYQLAGSEEDAAAEHALAEFAELSLEEFKMFLEAASALVEQNGPLEELKFGPQT